MCRIIHYVPKRLSSLSNRTDRLTRSHGLNSVNARLFPSASGWLNKSRLACYTWKFHGLTNFRAVGSVASRHSELEPEENGLMYEFAVAPAVTNIRRRGV